MLADQLRKSVLQAAIQGQLTEQLPTDGDSRDLLKKIRAEKAKLVKDKKIKLVTLPPISEDEIPFKIPANWCWVRLGDVCNYGINETISPQNMKIGKFLLDLEDIEKDTGKLIEKKFFDGTNAKSSKNIFKRGQVLFGKLRVYLNKVIIADEDGYCTSEILPLDFGKNIFYRYAQIVLMSPMFLRYATRNSYGTKMPRFGTKAGQLALFPLPPLAEQKRIVDKLDELLKEIELLAADERELDELEKKFPRQMKNSLLQAAIQGQLTKQLPTDGDSRDLLKIIQSEKAKFFKAKKIKPVTLSPISDDDLPFKIPANWCWVRLGDVCTLTKGKKVCVGSLPYLDAKYLRGLKDKVLVDKGIHISQDTRIILVDGDNSGEMFEVTEDGYLGSTFQVVELSQNILADYFQYFIMLKKDFYGKNKRGSAIPHLDRQIFFSTLIPLPPIAEQKRIVARLDELLTLCEV